MPPAPLRPPETVDQMRHRILTETARFIEWGLRNPDKVDRIPRYVIGTGDFPMRIKRFFWPLALRNPHGPDENAGGLN